MSGSKVRNTGSRKVVHKLSFIRHAETEKNAGMSKNEEAFSQKGKEQVEALTQKLLSNDTKYDHIYVSPFWRAQNTIDPYLKSSNFGYSSISSYTDSDIQECCWDSSSDRSTEVKRAASKILDRLKAESSPKNVLVVGHYHSGSMLIKEITGEEVGPRNTQIMVFDVEVDSGSQQDPANASCRKSQVGILNSDLYEASGIALSKKYPGTFYTHNDSGGSNEIYKFNKVGESLGKIRIDNSSAKDWEDIEVAACGSTSCVYIADIGNNNGDRNELRIYEFEETDKDNSRANVLSFSYPNRVARNAEAFMINPKTNRKYIIEKTTDATNTLFQFPESSTSGQTAELEKVCDLSVVGTEKVTAADIDDTGKRMLVRTYEYIFEFAVDDVSNFDSICNKKTKKIAHSEQQGEAISYDLNSSNFYTLSEGKSQPIYYFDCSNDSFQDSSEVRASSLLPADNPDCSDLKPERSSYSCERQASWGKCNESWMTAAGNCLKSCGKCPSTSNSSPHESVDQNSSSCADIRPPGSSHSCSQQAEWGKCGRSWMRSGNYCAKSCGRCK